jgi:predicted Fe-S protein YdhL (DUF1289 family)
LQICIGCGRDLAEIAQWSQLSAPERARLMGVARRRLAQIARPASA